MSHDGLVVVSFESVAFYSNINTEIKYSMGTMSNCSQLAKKITILHVKMCVPVSKHIYLGLISKH